MKTPLIAIKADDREVSLEGWKEGVNQPGNRSSVELLNVINATEGSNQHDSASLLTLNKKNSILLDQLKRPELTSDEYEDSNELEEDTRKNEITSSHIQETSYEKKIKILNIPQPISPKKNTEYEKKTLKPIVHELFLLMFKGLIIKNINTIKTLNKFSTKDFKS